MTLPELLAPAGDYDILVTAINAGADAVYISGERFGARAFAKNFTLEEIEKSVEYAHLNGAKIHVTVNTLINNFEVIDVVKYLFYLYKIGVDAVIVQDLGIIELIKNLIPGDKNFFIYSLNYIINTARILFPFELLFKGPLYIAFVLYQITCVAIVVRGLKKVNGNNILIVSLLVGYFMLLGTYEPDFGSVIRHESVLLPFFIAVNDDILKSNKAQIAKKRVKICATDGCIK